MTALRQAQLFECPVCKQHIDDAERQQEAGVRLACAAHRCPACGLAAPDFKTRALGAYKRRVDRWVKNARMSEADKTVAEIKAIAEARRQEWKFAVLERDRHEAAIRRARALWVRAIAVYKAARHARREAAP